MHKSSLNLSVDSIQIGFHYFVFTAFLLHLAYSNISWNVSGGAKPAGSILGNLGSLEIRASTYISAKLKKTIHCSFQLKWTLEAVKLLFLFTQSMIYRYSFD